MREKKSFSSPPMKFLPFRPKLVSKKPIRSATLRLMPILAPIGYCLPLKSLTFLPISRAESQMSVHRLSQAGSIPSSKKGRIFPPKAAISDKSAMY